MAGIKFSTANESPQTALSFLSFSLAARNTRIMRKDDRLPALRVSLTFLSFPARIFYTRLTRVFHKRAVRVICITRSKLRDFPLIHQNLRTHINIHTRAGRHIRSVFPFSGVSATHIFFLLFGTRACSLSRSPVCTRTIILFAAALPPSFSSLSLSR